MVCILGWAAGLPLAAFFAILGSVVLEGFGIHPWDHGWFMLVVLPAIWAPFLALAFVADAWIRQPLSTSHKIAWTIGLMGFPVSYFVLPVYWRQFYVAQYDDESPSQ